MMGVSCCCPPGISENLECNVEETDEGLVFKVKGKTPEQTEALKTFYKSVKTLKGDSDCCCC